MDWYTSSRCFLVTPLPPAVPSSLPISFNSSIALFVCHPPSPCLIHFSLSSLPPTYFLLPSRLPFLSPRLTACFPSYHPFIRSIISLSVPPSLLPLLLDSHTLPPHRSLHSSFRPSFSVPTSISLPLFFPPSLPCLSLPPSLSYSFHAILCFSVSEV